MRRLFLLLLLTAFVALPLQAQIVNRLKVDDPTFQRYAWGRIQQYNPDNLVLADSLYTVAVQQGNYRYRCLALSLEFPVRYALGEYERMDEAVTEIKEIIGRHPEAREFYYPTLYEYCQYLVSLDRASDAMLEARAMERIATEENSASGHMYAHRIVGLIQSYRTNSHLAIQNYLKAVEDSQAARAEQELPNLYILIAQEYIRQKDFKQAEAYCRKAEEYQDYFPALRTKIRMTRAYLYDAEGDWEAFWETYDALVADPLYKVQTDNDARYEMDVAYLQSRGLFEEALAKADSLGTARLRHEKKHAIYAAQGAFTPAYGELSKLLAEKDSIYIKVQNEDMAILDAEMNNAQLRQDAERLRSQNQITVLLGFLALSAIAFFFILFSQWQLRQSLEEMQKKNRAMLAARNAYRKALDAKESENETKIKILRNRKSNSFNL